MTQLPAHGIAFAAQLRDLHSKRPPARPTTGSSLCRCPGRGGMRTNRTTGWTKSSHTNSAVAPAEALQRDRRYAISNPRGEAFKLASITLHGMD